MQIICYNEHRLCVLNMCAEEHDVYVDMMTKANYHLQREYSDLS